MDKYVGWTSPKGEMVIIEEIKELERTQKMDVYQYLGNDCHYCIGNDKEEIIDNLRKYAILEFELIDESIF